VLCRRRPDSSTWPLAVLVKLVAKCHWLILCVFSEFLGCAWVACMACHSAGGGVVSVAWFDAGCSCSRSNSSRSWLLFDLVRELRV
jgi:hypothetical protein